MAAKGLESDFPLIPIPIRPSTHEIHEIPSHTAPLQWPIHWWLTFSVI